MNTIMETENKQIQKKKTLKGIVVSDKMNKTVVVEITRYEKQPKKYGKFRKLSKRFKAHDENNACKIGDTVLIEETAPISKDKSFKIKEII